jgi:hypothetical protein
VTANMKSAGVEVAGRIRISRFNSAAIVGLALLLSAAWGQFLWCGAQEGEQAWLNPSRVSNRPTPPANTLESAPLVSSADMAQEFVKHTIISEWTGAIDVEGVDMDGDGDLDILGAAYHETDAINWWENDGYQNFTLHNITMAPEHGVIDIRSVDLDQDGDLDVLAASAYGSATGLNAVLWYENDGSQSFAEHTLASGVDYPEWVDAADLDEDGDLDVVVNAAGTDAVLWFENDGSQSFTRHTLEDDFSPVYSTGPLYGEIIDLNRDGHLDVVVVGEGLAEIAWWQGDGTGGFVKHLVPTGFSTYGSWSVRAGDLDGDTDLDLVVHGYNGLAWFENDGVEGYTYHAIESSFRSYYAAPVLPIDLDRDGDVDVVAGTFGASGPCCSTADDDVVWWENDGSGNLSRHVIEKVFAGPWNLFVLDLDGDGDNDVLGAADYGYEIAWWERIGGTQKEISPYLAEDFERYAPGESPPAWLDQAADFASGNFYQALEVDGQMAYGPSDSDSLYSHYSGPSALDWQNYQVRGRLRFDRRADSIALTFYSYFPAGHDRYYQLLRYSNETGFRVDAHGTDITGGISSVDVGVQPDTWYRFRVRIHSGSDRVRIVARVWEDGEPEPSNWQIDCYDDSTARITAGTVGVWSQGNGMRVIDDLVVQSLDAAAWSGFPLGLYDVQTGDLSTVQASSFDWAHRYGSAEGESEAIAYLQAAGSTELAVVQNMPSDYLTYSEAFWIGRVDALRSRDELAVWYLPEEPDNHSAIEMLHSLARLRDEASRPAGTYFADLTNLESWCDVMDVLFVGAYPEYSGEPRVSMMARLDIAQKACPGLPIVGVPMLFDTNYDGTGDYPTPHEARADAYTALIAGASGLQWQSYAYGKDVPDLWQAVQDIAGELTSLEPVIMATDSTTPAAMSILSGPQLSPEASGRSYLSIQFLQKEFLGDEYLVAVNVATDAVVAEFGGLSESAVHALVLFEDRALPVSGGVFSDTFSAAEVHVYQVTETNQPPESEDDADGTDEDTAISIAVLENDRDPEGTTLVVGTVGVPGLGTASIDGTAVTYTPINQADDYTSVFTYTASDGNATDTAMVTIYVDADDDPPIAEDDADSTDEDTAIIIDVLDNDRDLERMPLTVGAVGMPSLGTASTDGSTVTYTPANRTADYTAVFTYTASDGSLSDTATVTVQVSADNEPPDAVDDLDSTDEDTPRTIGVLSNDSDPDTDAALILSTLGVPDLGTAIIDGTMVVYTPTNRSADYTPFFSYTVSDGALSDTATVTIVVSADNDLPEAEDDTDSTDEDTPVTLSVLSNDTDPDTDDALSIVGVGVPNLGSASTQGALVVYTPTNSIAAYSGVFTYAVSDGELNDTATVTILVDVDNDPPVAEDDADSTDEDTPITISVLSNDFDPEGMSLSVRAVGAPNVGKASTDGTSIVFTPTNRTADYVSVFTYTAGDGGQSSTATVTVLVSADNDPPGAVDDTHTTNEDVPIAIPVLSNDFDPDTDDTLSVGVVGIPNVGTATTDGSMVVYAPTNQVIDYAAVFTYTISDGMLADMATVTVSVDADNDPPTISDIPDQITTLGGTVGPIGFTVNDAETAPGSLVISAGSSNPAVVPPEKITLGGSGADRTLTITPTASPVATATITVTASDGEQTTASCFELRIMGFMIYLPLVTTWYGGYDGQ